MNQISTTMRNTFFMVFALFLFSCDKKDKEIKVENFLTVSKTEIAVKTNDNFKDTLIISSNQSWTVTGLPNWITANSLSGTGNGMIILTGSNNSGNISREVTIKINSGIIEKTVRITQPAFQIDTSQPIVITQTSHYLDVSDGPAYMSFPGGTPFDIPAGQSFSISMKMKTNYQPGGNERILKARNGTSAGYEIISSTTGQMGLNVTSTDGEGLGSKYGITNVYDGKWHHIVAVFDATTKKSFFYIDGKPEGESDHSGGRYAAITARLPFVVLFNEYYCRGLFFFFLVYV